jgi:hypothetical protein
MIQAFFFTNALIDERGYDSLELERTNGHQPKAKVAIHGI